MAFRFIEKNYKLHSKCYTSKSNVLSIQICTLYEYTKFKNYFQLVNFDVKRKLNLAQRPDRFN